MSAQDDDFYIEQGSGNIFVDLGFDEVEAQVLNARSEVMVQLVMFLQEQGWTQAEMARRLGISQSRVSRLIHKKLDEFSFDMLLTLSARAGLRPQVRLAA